MDEENTGNPAAEADGAGGSGHRTRFIILGVVLALAVGYMVYAAFPGNALYFLTVSEFMGQEEYQDGRLLRVSGKLVEGSFQREDGSTRSRFKLADEEGGSGEKLAASYVGVMPDLFFNPHSEIILQGKYQENEVFHANQIMVKCPSKYRDLAEEQGTEASG